MADAAVYTCIPLNPNPGVIDVFDLTTNAAAAGSPFTLPGYYPCGLDISPDNQWLAITLQGGVLGSPQLLVADISNPLSPSFGSLIQVGVGPIGCVFDSTSTFLYVNNEYGDGVFTDPGSVTQLQLISGVWTVINTIQLSQAVGTNGGAYAQRITITDDDRWVINQYYANGTGTAVDFIDTTLTPPVVVFTTNVDAGPDSTAVLNGTDLLVAIGGPLSGAANNIIDILDLSTLPGSAPTLGGTPITVGQGPTCIVTNNAKTKAATPCIIDNSLWIVDAANLFAPVQVSDPSGFLIGPIQCAWSPDDSLIVVSNGFGPSVATVDVASATVISSRATVGAGALANAITPGQISREGQGTMIAFA